MSDNRYPSQKLDQYMLRLPDGMRDRIKAAADGNNRSMNAEIVATLEEKYPTPYSRGDDKVYAAAVGVMFHPSRSNGEFTEGYQNAVRFMREALRMDDPEGFIDQFRSSPKLNGVMITDLSEWMKVRFWPWLDTGARHAAEDEALLNALHPTKGMRVPRPSD